MPIGLVDHEHVGDLHQAGLVRLHAVAPARIDDDDGGVGLAGDLDLDLPDSDRLDEDQVAADRVEQPHRLGRGEREATEVAARRHRTDEHAGVGRMILHPHPVAEYRSTGER